MQEAGGDVGGLIRRAKRYDRDAFAALYNQTVKPVFRYLSARVSTPEEAEDLTQEVFMAALERMPGLRAEDETGLLAWLFQIARHKIADSFRRRYRWPAASLDSVDDPPGPEAGPEEIAAAQDERALVRQAMVELTDEQREVIIFKFVMGYDNQRTAELVGKNVNAVNQLQHRALASLHRLLERTEVAT